MQVLLFILSAILLFVQTFAQSNTTMTEQPWDWGGDKMTDSQSGSNFTTICLPLMLAALAAVTLARR